jgi:hypothetical protein
MRLPTGQLFRHSSEPIQGSDNMFDRMVIALEIRQNG